MARTVLPRSWPTAQLSGGQKQRLALAGALAMQPGLVLLDEPTANLDPEGVVEVRDAVARVVEATGATLVVVEHRVSVWLPVVDRVVVLAAGGGVLADGAPEEVLDRQRGRLTEAGVWVPGVAPEPPVRRRASSRGPLLEAAGLAVGDGVEAVGGRATLVGPIIGAFIVNGAKSWLTVAAPEFCLYFLGALFIGVTLFLPDGVAGLARRIYRRGRA